MEVLIEGLKQIMLIIYLISDTIITISLTVIIVMLILQLWEDFRR